MDLNPVLYYYSNENLMTSFKRGNLKPDLDIEISQTASLACSEHRDI